MKKLSNNKAELQLLALALMRYPLILLSSMQWSKKQIVPYPEKA